MAKTLGARWAVEVGGVRVPRSEFSYKRDAILYAAVVAGHNVATLAELKEFRPDIRIVRVR